LKDKYFDYIIHGGDYNPDQWADTPEIWDEDMRLMKLAHINSATMGIFAWSKLEPEEGVFDFSWLDTMMDKCAENNIAVILATPSGARPAWLAEKYPEVLRVADDGVRYEYGVRHNHCANSPIYREKVQLINRKLAERYKDHPALKMWHINNEYSGYCYCNYCRKKFQDYLREKYDNDISKLNYNWWNGFWSHNLNDFRQINPPSNRGENHVSALKLEWYRFVTQNTIDFYENEIIPLRELTPDIPITTNFMTFNDQISYHEFAKHVDFVSWDSYPHFGDDNTPFYASNAGFIHDMFRSAKGGKPFFLMESTPSIVNHHPVNKIPPVELSRIYSLQAVAHGADSIQYFQFRKSRGSHEKLHGAVVDHCGQENTRVFRGIAETGRVLEKLAPVTGTRLESRVAIIFDYENMVAFYNFSGYNNEERDYPAECVRWYQALSEMNIGIDVIPTEADYSEYDLVIAPTLYLLKDGTEEKIEKYVADGGTFVATYLTAVVNEDDMVFYGGLPAGKLKDVFGLWAEETDSIPVGYSGKAIYNGKEYTTDIMCDLINPTTAKVLGTYGSDFYAGNAAVTVNNYGKGRAYYCAFGNKGDFRDDFCRDVVNALGITPDTAIGFEKGVSIRKRGDFIFITNFADKEKQITLDKEYTDVVNEVTVEGVITLPAYGYLVLK